MFNTSNTVNTRKIQLVQSDRTATCKYDRQNSLCPAITV